MPGTALIIPRYRADAKSGFLDPPANLRHGQGTEREREAVQPFSAAPALHVFLVEHRQTAPRVLAHGFPERETRAAVAGAGERDPARVLGPPRQVGHEIDPEHAVAPQHPRNA